MKLNKRPLFTKYSKSSAAMATLVLHALLVVGGLSYVVMVHVIPEDPAFAGHEIRRTKPLPRIRPPMSATRPKKVTPKIERIPVETKFDQQMPEFSLPELPGAKGEFGGARGAAVDSLSTMGFTMPELGLFNLSAKGEKIFLILDAGPHMLVDEMGGIPAYTIIKQELLRIVDELPPTAVFNLCVFSNNRSFTLFPNLVKATESNARIASEWLMPLNGVEESVETGRYGLQTMGAGGTEQREDLRVCRFSGRMGEHQYHQERWFRPAMLAMRQGADTVFLLTNTWGHQRVVSKDRKMSLEKWYTTSAGKRWLRGVDEARVLLEEENRLRRSKGQPPRVISHGRWGLMDAYFPGVERPPVPEFYYFTPNDFQDAFEAVRGEAHQTRSGLHREDRFTFNVVQFVPVDSEQGKDERFYKLTKKCRGGYQTIAGLEAIRSYVKGGAE